MLLASTLSLLGHALLVAALLTRPLRTRRWPLAWRGAATGVTVAVAFAPFDGVPVVGYLRAAFGDLSITSLLLLAAALFSFLTGRSLFPAREVRLVLAAVAALAVLLYPFALGFTYFDSYALGYGSYVLVTALFVLTMAAWHAGVGMAVLCAVGAGAAYFFGLLESDNLWDYLIDPLVAVYALSTTATWIAQTRRNTRPARPATGH
jgi:NADH:ubiquinone oxidoreductase subunit K